MGRKKSARKRSHVNRKQQVSLTPDKGTLVQRTYKDSLFRFIFRDKQKLLKLYNALNGTEYQDMEGLTVTTLENVLYIGYKNDVSFLLDNTLSLYEHQGSWNPNMPLRGVLYFARLLQDYTEMNRFNLYGSKQIPLPYPKYIIFYNGTAPRPEREILRLSDSFPVSASTFAGEPALECTALVLNINYGQNREIMEQCKPLMDYALFIHYIRRNLEEGCSVQEAADLAVNQCLKEDILTDVLRAHRKEVTAMFLEEYDQEKHYKTLLEEGFEEGYEAGLEKGLEDGLEKGLKDGLEKGLKDGLEKGLKDGLEKGLKDGLEEGLKKGLEEGLEQFKVLSQKLTEDNRQGDIIRAAMDRDFQKKLFQEYGLQTY